MPNIKKSQSKLGEHFSPQADQWALQSGKSFIPGHKNCRACWHLSQSLNTGNATSSSTSSSTESKAESLTHLSMDTTMINTSFELCLVSPLKQHDKNKQTQAVEARCKILKTANILLSKANQESTSVKICEKQEDCLTKDDKEKIEHSNQLCEAISEKMQSADRITKIQLLTFDP